MSETDLAILTALCRPYLDAPSRFCVPAPNKRILEELAQKGIYLGSDALRGHLRGLYARFGVEDGLVPTAKRARLAELVRQSGAIAGWTNAAGGHEVIAAAVTETGPVPSPDPPRSGSQGARSHERSHVVLAQDPVLQTSVEVRAPDGTSTTIALSGKRATVGRPPAVNDIVLEPDPDQYVSREHCLIELDGRVWRVVDKSRNGTLLRRGDKQVKVRDPEALSDGDVICILAGPSQSAGPSYWELVFRNPMETTPVLAGTAQLEYNRESARLYRIVGTDREELGLPHNVHLLLRHLAKRNADNGDVAVMCSRDELMQAIWGDVEPQHPPEELNRLIFDLRRLVELVPAQPRFVQTVRGLGFRLDPRPTAE